MFEWFLDSLERQIGATQIVHVIVVDLFKSKRQEILSPRNNIGIRSFEPKPNVWQGNHRLTKQDWWAKSNAINTAICLCKTEWIAFVDDRSVLLPGWLNSIYEAMSGNYVVAGSYEKVHDLVVENGLVKSYKEPGDGKDPRAINYRPSVHKPVKRGNWFGCCGALPLEWALEINGADETCDGLGMEDCVFGEMLENNGRAVMFDPRMKILEDRTPSEIGGVPVRSDKNISPNDKSHALRKKLDGLKRAAHQWDIRAVRESVLAGNSFPIPTEPSRDWYDNQPLSEMVPQ